MFSDLATASQGCALFSATGILFMSFVGIMLMKQPFFIGGIEDVEVAKGSAFGAAGTFFLTFLVSIFYLLNAGRRLGGISSSSSMSSGTGRGHLERFGEYSTIEIVENATQEETVGGYQDFPALSGPIQRTNTGGYQDYPTGDRGTFT